MANLKYYNQIEYEESKFKIYEEREITKICKKLSKHFKFPLSKVKFKNMHRTLAMANFDYTLTFNKNKLIDITDICHECGHLYLFKYDNQINRYGKNTLRKHYHSKKLTRIIRKMLNYCIKNKSIMNMTYTEKSEQPL